MKIYFLLKNVYIFLDIFYTESQYISNIIASKFALRHSLMKEKYEKHPRFLSLVSLLPLHRKKKHPDSVSRIRARALQRALSKRKVKMK